jgi:hypothetical protein
MNNEITHVGNPLPKMEAHTLASICEKWAQLPDDVKQKAICWVNSWAALSGGFRVEMTRTGELILEPARVRESGEGRAIRRSVERLIGELRASHSLAEAVQTSAALAWRRSLDPQPGAPCND